MLLGFTLSGTMFGLILWVEEHQHEPEFPLEHCSVANINVTHLSCQGFNVVVMIGVIIFDVLGRKKSVVEFVLYF